MFFLKFNHSCVFVSYAWTWTLIITDVSDDDVGEYTCRVPSNNRTLTIIKQFNLTVLSRWRIHTDCENVFRFLAPPKIIDITIESVYHNVLLENEQVILKCLVRANPSAHIQWIYTEPTTNNHRNFINYHNQLLIRNFSRFSPTNYQCIADNGIPPRDIRSRQLVPASRFFEEKKKLIQLVKRRNVRALMHCLEQ